MQIDELIKALVETKETYGNINVRICDMEDGGHMIEGFDVIDERNPRKNTKMFSISNSSVTRMTAQKRQVERKWSFGVIPNI